jgi:peptide chain release factor 1
MATNEKAILDKFELLERRLLELHQLLSQPEVATDRLRLQSLAQEHAGLRDKLAKFHKYKKTCAVLESTRGMLGNDADSDLVALAGEEITLLENRRDQLLDEIRAALVQRDPYDEKDVIVEIRAGTGGEEASIFAADLYRMYARYAQSRRWQVEVIDVSESERGGFKEVVFEVKGKGAFSKLKFERGVHRVQRVPVTEAAGRIHTSTATVAVMPEPEDVDVQINPEDIKMEFYRSGGAGGQNVNKVSSCVRLTHIPTGIVAACQDERSQLRNRQKAMAVLKARIFDFEQRKHLDLLTEERRSQIGGGERSEKIRTYNFPQNRVTDHRLEGDAKNYTLKEVIEGNLEPVIENLKLAERAEILRQDLVV